MPSSSLPRWNLSDLYASITDPAIDRCLLTQERRAERFAKTYRGKIRTRSAAQLLMALRAYESILQETWKPEIYATLVNTADSSPPTHGALLQKTKTRGLAIAQHLLFFELELMTLEEKTLRRLMGDSRLAPYRHYLEKQLSWKPHRLSETEEKILNDKSLTGRSAFVRLFDEEFAHKMFTLKQKGKTRRLTEEEVLDRLHHPRRAERKRAAAAFTLGLKEEARRVTFVMNTLLQDKHVDDRYRKFARPEESRHLENEIDQATVDAMTGAVTDAYGMVQDFYRFKRKRLRVPELFDYDRYAPITKTEQRYSFAEARELVLSSFHHFSPKFGELTQHFFDQRWIDAPPGIGKRGGAFCMFVTPDLHPYVFLNFTGNLKQVLTLAHELGHGVHASLARKQTLLHFDMPLTLAETASVFAEMIVFDALRQQIQDPQERFALYVHKIESVFATVFRQVSMYKFEQDLHAAARVEGELPQEKISQLWRARQHEMFGRSVTLTPDYDLWWMYISHFVHTPFYVYAYAFGELLTLSLFAEYKKRGPAFVERYLAFLTAGGSQSPDELLRSFGINLRDRKFWEGGLALIQELVEEAKRIIS